MSSYITMYKLDAVRKSLVSKRYGEKNAEIYSKISNLVYDLVYSKIPKSVKTLFEELESDYINSKTDPDHTPNLPEYSGNTNFFKTVTRIYWWSTGGMSHNILDSIINMMHEEGISKNETNISTLYIKLHSVLPCSEQFMEQIVLEEVKKKGELYNALKECILLDKKIRTLDNSIKCLFTSKRFYLGTLKNEFPEAYEKLIELFPESLEELKSNPSSCDTIEEIRATLSSNK